VTELFRTDSSNGDFGLLVDQLNGYLAVINGEQHGFYSQFNQVDSIPNVVVAYVDDLAVGCGAFRILETERVEIKRMFVSSTHRGQGIAQRVLCNLENWAVEIGATHAFLETSKRMLPAVSLYRKSGYTVIPNYGPYVDIEDSVCMGKALCSLVT